MKIKHGILELAILDSKEIYEIVKKLGGTVIDIQKNNLYSKIICEIPEFEAVDPINFIPIYDVNLETLKITRRNL